MKIAVIVVSVLLNLVLAYLLFSKVLVGCAEIEDGRIGVLGRDIEVGAFDSDQVLFTLPKGLVVREASATGADWFEPHRFRIVVTSDDEALVNYDPVSPKLVEQDYEFYSAEVGGSTANE